MIAAGIALGVVGFLGGQAAHAAVISVEGSSNCDGPDAWVATWVIRVSADSADELWRLDVAGEVGEPRSVAEPTVLEHIHSMDEPIADLDAVATFIVDGSTAAATSTMERPAVCASAPAPVALGETIPVESPQPDVVAPAAASSEPDAAVEPAPAAASPAVPVAAAVASASVPTSAETATGASASELPATGSTSGLLVVLALASIVAGAALMRLARGPMRA